MRKIWLASVMLSMLVSDGAQALQLIAEQEAKLPAPKGATAVDQRGIFRSPKVELMAPKEDVHSPTLLQLKFEAFGGAKIDLESVRVIYLRSPNVDLTSRVKQFIRADGIKVPDAELPAGEYMMRVDVKDSDGRPGTTIFKLKVTP